MKLILHFCYFTQFLNGVYKKRLIYLYYLFILSHLCIECLILSMLYNI